MLQRVIIAVAQSSGSHAWSCGSFVAGWGPVAGWARGRWAVDVRFVLLNGGHYLGLPHVVHRLLHLGGGGWKFVAETLVERLFGLQGGAIEAVGATAVAEAHRLRHLGGFGLGEDVEGGHAEGDNVSRLQHFRSGAGFVGGKGVDDLGPGFVLVPGGCGEVGSRKAMIVSRNELGRRAMVGPVCSCAFVLALVAGDVKNIT